MKALLIEDEGLTREGLALLIQVVDPDISVIQAASCQEALRAIAEIQFDFIFLDVQLNGESGLDFLDYLKNSGISTPVIMLSSHDDRETIINSLSRGAFGFIPKQTENTGVIRLAMELALKGGVYLPPSLRGRGAMAAPLSSVGAAKMMQLKQVSASDIGLSPRLYETIYYVSQGLSNKSIARKMGISDNVVAEYVKNAYQYLKPKIEELIKENIKTISNRAAFMVFLNRSGWQLVPPSNINEQ